MVWDRLGSLLRVNKFLFMVDDGKDGRREKIVTSSVDVALQFHGQSQGIPC